MAGIALSFSVGKAVAGLLYGVSVENPFVLVSSIAILCATALLAAWIPARRAASVDPVIALRHE